MGHPGYRRRDRLGRPSAGEFGLGARLEKRRESLRFMRTVLVTGGTGFIARWGIVQLLEHGYRVRTTVRDPVKEAVVRAALGEVVDPGDRLDFVIVDLLDDAGWPDAVAGCRFVLHPASPLGHASEDVLVATARDG